MWNRILARILILLLVSTPCASLAVENDPDDSLNINGKITVLGKGARAPYQGILFDIPAATKLKLDKAFSQKRYELELTFEKNKIVFEHKLIYDSLKIDHESLKSKTDAILKIKSEEINRLQDLIKDSSGDYANWAFAGGLVAGILVSIGIFYTATEIKN